MLLFRTLADLECNLGIASKAASIITYPRIYINAGVGCVFVRRSERRPSTCRRFAHPMLCRFPPDRRIVPIDGYKHRLDTFAVFRALLEALDRVRACRFGIENARMAR